MNTTTYDSLAQRFAADANERLRATAQAIADRFQHPCSPHTLAHRYLCHRHHPRACGLAFHCPSVWSSIVTGSTFVFLFLIIGLWLIGDFVRLWWTGYQGSPALALRSRLLDDILAPWRVSNTLHAFTANGVFFVGFLTIKKNIPIAVPFAWDQPFMETRQGSAFRRAAA